jgi:uncharacterized protein YlaI
MEKPSHNRDHSPQNNVPSFSPTIKHGHFNFDTEKDQSYGLGVVNIRIDSSMSDRLNKERFSFKSADFPHSRVTVES